MLFVTYFVTSSLAMFEASML